MMVQYAGGYYELSGEIFLKFTELISRSPSVETGSALQTMFKDLKPASSEKVSEFLGILAKAEADLVQPHIIQDIQSDD